MSHQETCSQSSITAAYLVSENSACICLIPYLSVPATALFLHWQGLLACLTFIPLTPPFQMMTLYSQLADVAAHGYVHVLHIL